MTNLTFGSPDAKILVCWYLWKIHQTMLYCSINFNNVCF